MKRYAAVFSEQTRITRRFNEGARVVVEAMLQSPNFLFHVEAGPDGVQVVRRHGGGDVHGEQDVDALVGARDRDADHGAGEREDDEELS